jgi:GNAT superfamily N-acetyltransferase
VPTFGPLPAQAPTGLLATLRDAAGDLIAAAALRPTTPAGIGRLWGPAVHPGRQRRGHGRHLLHAITAAARTNGMPLTGATSAEIPAVRLAGQHLFATAGWTIAAELLLLEREVPIVSPRAGTDAGDHAEIEVRLADPSETDLDGRLADLQRRCHPEAGTTASLATLARWSSDERFAPDCLTIASRPATARLVAATLVYPLAHAHPGEPAEALLADLLVDPDAGPFDGLRIRRRMIREALTSAAARQNARTARALIDRRDSATVEALVSLGFTEGGAFHTYRPPGPSPPRATP